jgi:hypothetical protein
MEAVADPNGPSASLAPLAPSSPLCPEGRLAANNTLEGLATRLVFPSPRYVVALGVVLREVFAAPEISAECRRLSTRTRVTSPKDGDRIDTMAPPPLRHSLHKLSPLHVQGSPQR